MLDMTATKRQANSRVRKDISNKLGAVYPERLIQIPQGDIGRFVNREFKTHPHTIIVDYYTQGIERKANEIPLLLPEQVNIRGANYNLQYRLVEKPYTIEFGVWPPYKWQNPSTSKTSVVSSS